MLSVTTVDNAERRKHKQTCCGNLGRNAGVKREGEIFLVTPVCRQTHESKPREFAKNSSFSVSLSF